jgi:serine/threonine protein kinase
MAKVYGGRWEIVDGPKLGQGGQGEVFRARDVSGRLEGEFALKRVPDINRRDRFLREVEAIKRLTDPARQAAHPNIISLIDHSALEDTADPGKQFLVMPIAQGGDLSTPGRLALYRDSIDAVLRVATQLASALQAAHQAGVIHRDVKPKNVLFTGSGHETWLSDFGICLIREAPRLTETPEVMGPRAFMAPELEDDGQLDVTPAADIYSLGKVIYFMLSGGVIVPRERLHETPYAGLFDKGQRYGLLEILLRRMVCPLDRRITTATEVLGELKKIEDWEKNAQLLPMGQKALEAVQKLQRRSMESARITEANMHARRREAESPAAVQTSVTAWLTAELQKVAITVDSENIACTVEDAEVPGNLRIQTGPASSYSPLNGVEMVLEDKNDQYNRIYRLQFFLCREGRVVVRVMADGDATTPAIEPARDFQLAIVPLYRQGFKHHGPGTAASLGYISRESQIGQARGRLEMPRGGRIAHTFEVEVAVHAPFRASEWPGNEATLREMLDETLGVFFTQLGT